MLAVTDVLLPRTLVALATLMFALLNSTLSFALTPVNINLNIEAIRLDPYCEYREDADRSLDIRQLIEHHEAQAWQNIEHNRNNFGYLDGAMWLHLQLYSPSLSTQRYLEIGYPVLDYIDLFIVDESRVILHQQLGDKYPFYQRPIKHPNFVVPFAINKNQVLDVYIRVETSSLMEVPLWVRSQTNIVSNTQHNMLVMGLYCGAIFILMLYNLFIFFLEKETSIFYYICYAACVMLFLTSLSGISFQYLWPKSVWWNDQSIVVCLAGMLIFGSLLSREFLGLSSRHSKQSLAFSVLILAGIISAVLSLFLPFRVMIITTATLALVGMVAIIVSSILRSLNGYGPAKLYLCAWSLLLLGSIVLAMSKAGLFPVNILTENALPFAAAIDVILLSFALANRTNVKNTDHYQTQQLSQQLARQAKANQEAALLSQRKTTEHLESRLKQRSMELESVNRKLEELSTNDGLTGVRNSRYFDNCLTYEFARALREQSSIALLLINIDHFKKFNENYGHLEGDDCLVIIAKTIQEQVRREVDVVARYAGKEFGVLLSNTAYDAAHQLAEKIRQTIENLSFIVNKQVVRVTVSIGVAVIRPGLGDSTTRLLTSADKALRVSKTQGRNRVNVVDDSTLKFDQA